MTSEQTDFESLVSQNSNLEEVQAFIRGPEASTIAPEILLNTLDACVTLLRQNNMHVEEHKNLNDTLQAANVELKGLVAGLQTRLDESVADNTAVAETLAKVTTFHERIQNIHTETQSPALREQVSVMEERLSAQKQEHLSEKRSLDLKVKQLRARLSAMVMMRR